MACVACPSGQLCINKQCQTPMVTKKIGDACTTAEECQASLGPSAICKTMTSSGNAIYVGGYCTIPCTSQNDPVCGTDAFCVGLRPRYGEQDVFCWARCSNGNTCRTPGYACYDLDGPKGCWLSPLPAEDAGPPADKIGNPCTADSQCQNPPDQGGICSAKDSDLGLIFPGGYCSTDFCNSNEECAADGGALCVGFGDRGTRCMRRCAMGGGSFADAGQSDCRDDYLCLSLTLRDGGLTPHGICLPRPPPPPTTVGQSCTSTSDCDDNGTTFGTCLPETFSLPDGGRAQSGNPGGYCTLVNCESDSDCGPSGTGVCLLITQDPNAAVQTLCFASCPAGGQGQSTCRSGYVCQSFRLADGGTSTDGYCDARCDAPGNSCPTGRTCNASGYCQ
jgi:hypothetical protein